MFVNRNNGKSNINNRIYDYFDILNIYVIRKFFNENKKK